MNTFADKVAVVTGGASGIGRAVCKELARRGAVVVVADLDEKGARAVASAITGTAGRALAVRTDVTKCEEVSALVNTAVREFGRLDYLFNNAGVGVGGEARDMELSHWKFVLDVNLWGVIHGVHAAYPVMIRQGFGHIALRGLQHASRDALGAGLELSAVGRQADQHPALVGRIAQAGQQPGGLHALEQRGQGAGVQAQPFAEFGHGQAITLPQHQQGQVLRVGQAQLIEQRLVQLGHGQRCRIQREAQLVVQQQGLFRQGVPGGVACDHGVNCSWQLNCVQFNCQKPYSERGQAGTR